MKRPFPECEFCEHANEGSETLGCAAEKLRKAGAELIAVLPLLRRLLPPDGFDCNHFAMSAYARRKEKMHELAALYGKGFAQRICALIRAEHNVYGYEYEMDLWELVIEGAKSGMDPESIARRIECVAFRKNVMVDGI